MPLVRRESPTLSPALNLTAPATEHGGEVMPP